MYILGILPFCIVCGKSLVKIKEKKMNNDEKNISAAEEVPAEKKTPTQEKAPTAPQKSSGFGAWWKNLKAGIKAAIIAGLALVVIVPTVLIILLSGNKGGFGGPAGIGGGGAGKTANYSVTVVTKGGMAMAKLPVYIYEYDDGALGDLVDGGYAATDDNGKATFKLPKNGNYAAKIDLSLPDGYDVKPYYPLVSADLSITISSSVIPESSLVGVTYNLGDVMRDFTVTTTENKTFTLSEILKDKKAVLINFWYTTCSWCITEFPLMQAAYEKYSDDLAIIALDPYQDDTLVDIKSFQSQMGLTFDVAQDFTSLSTAFNVTGYPTSVVIDRYGVISMIEAGAITSERAFDVLFEHFTAENYEQKLIYNYADIVPKEKPNVEMPDSDEISEVLDGGLIDGVEYLPYPSNASESEKEYSWPFIIDELEDGTMVVHPSNANKEGSYAQLIVNVPLKNGEALAFDWYSSTEKSADILYVIVDGKDIYSISGESEDWKSCFAYVAEEDATYEIALVYQKDSSDNVGHDTVYLKNLRVCDVEDINEPTYIYRFAATNPNSFSEYQDYVDIFLGDDGYYHVDSADGPILLANLMSYTRFSDDDYVYNMCLGKDYEKALVRYCNYASNSTINGVCPVTEELKDLLWKIVEDYGDRDNANDWLKLCCYYDSYGTDEELEDPIKGLATFSAYDVVLSNKGDTDFPNSITYNRVIMPRGLFSKFTPAESGTYLITSTAPGEKEGTFIDCEAWIFTADGLDNKTAWYTYANVDRFNVGDYGDMSNVYMMAYLEEGKDYYINIAYGDVYQEGTISFRVERLGGEGVYRFSLASPGFFTALENTSGELTETISGGIDVVLGTDGIWREKRTDGREGSILYADFTRPTGIFSQSITKLIEMGGFNLATNENDEYVKALMRSNQAYAYYLELYLKDLWGAEYSAKYEEYKVSDVLAGTYHGAEDADGKPTKSENDEYILGLLDSMSSNTEYNTHDNFREFLKNYWGEDSYAGYMTEYQVEDVLAGRYHGNGIDYTDEISAYLDKVINVGYNADLGETIEEGDERIGCVVVDAELAELLQVIMDKYTFEGVENSWAKLCYYHQYFSAETPN